MEIPPVTIREDMKPLMAATGQAVWAAAILEDALRTEVARLAALCDLPDLTRRAERRRVPAGVRLRDLEILGAPADLCQQIRTMLDRRNRLIHRVLEDYLPAAQDNDASAKAAAIAEITRFSYDCGDCTVSLAARWVLAEEKMKEEGGLDCGEHA